MTLQKKIKDIAQFVYEGLGPGHAEGIYRDAMSVQLQEEGYIVKTEAPVSITFITKKKKEMIVGNGRIDLLIQSKTKKSEKIILELKCVQPIIKNNSTNIENTKEYLQLSKYLHSIKSAKKGMIINFPFPLADDGNVEIFMGK
ncbi:MAG: GxxExxY protein [Candidatus Pelagibacter sp. TMED253]|jgi:GxxExxY protein|nr:MAG: GxxExxY protein [Candidatus Pelagibacter sp. TMED253]|tara:strand:- start:148 stop:576 length:429 start_codon:yes stop_codon:yes gene_type:complete